MRASDFDFQLPADRIAQTPLTRRDDARLYVLERATGRSDHRQVRELPSLLPEGALLVLNDTRVIPARLHGRKPTGGRVELLLCEPLPGDAPTWRCLGGASKPIRPGALHLDGGLDAEVLAVAGEYVDVRFGADTAGFDAWLAAHGEIPLPPYIHRDVARDPRGAADRERYQTVFARSPGAVAAPTAGLHFTPELFGALAARGIEGAAITLHVGPGTFAPLRVDELDGQRLHHERYDVPEATRAAFAAARAAGRPVVAVGTTVVRTLEACIAADGTLTAGPGVTDIFIRPGHRFRAVDAILTNFHLPKSSLLVLVAAFAGRERVLAAYADAVARGYRFYSYGDAMLIT